MCAGSRGRCGEIADDNPIIYCLSGVNERKSKELHDFERIKHHATPHVREERREEFILKTTKCDFSPMFALCFFFFIRSDELYIDEAYQKGQAWLNGE